MRVKSSEIALVYNQFSGVISYYYPGSAEPGQPIAWVTPGGAVGYLVDVRRIQPVEHLILKTLKKKDILVFEESDIATFEAAFKDMTNLQNKIAKCFIREEKDCFIITEHDPTKRREVVTVTFQKSHLDKLVITTIHNLIDCGTLPSEADGTYIPAGFAKYIAQNHIKNLRGNKQSTPNDNINPEKPQATPVNPIKLTLENILI